MKVYQGVVAIEGTGQVMACDVIEYEGRPCIVPHWLSTTPGTKQIPVRMVFVLELSLNPDAPHSPQAVCGRPLSIGVLDGSAQPPPGSGIQVLEVDTLASLQCGIIVPFNPR